MKLKGVKQFCAAIFGRGEEDSQSTDLWLESNRRDSNYMHARRFVRLLGLLLLVLLVWSYFAELDEVSSGSVT